MRKIPILYVIFLVITLVAWFNYQVINSYFATTFENWIISVTMIFGSFIAGASSEGGGAIAFPVLTLLLDVPPAIARNFSLAIQSIGMTAASLLIIGLGIQIEKRAILFSSIGGLLGIVAGTYFIVPLISPAETKLFFVSLWLSFGVALWYINRKRNRKVELEIIGFRNLDALKLMLFGLIGGSITSIFGNGIDILTFCLLTLHFRISEKIATPTSVVLMTINTIAGFLLHFFIIKDFEQQAFDYWMAAIPIVIFGAPMGAFVISKFRREIIAMVLYIIIVVQYIGACLVIKPDVQTFALSLIVLFSGLVFFFFLVKMKRKES